MYPLTFKSCCSISITQDTSPDIQSFHFRSSRDTRLGTKKIKEQNVSHLQAGSSSAPRLVPNRAHWLLLRLSRIAKRRGQPEGESERKVGGVRKEALRKLLSLGGNAFREFGTGETAADPTMASKHAEEPSWICSPGIAENHAKRDSSCESSSDEEMARRAGW